MKETNDRKNKKDIRKDVFFVVGEGGFEPPKVQPTDLQSAPFGHSGTLPYVPMPERSGTGVELVNGLEPLTC